MFVFFYFLFSIADQRNRAPDKMMLRIWLLFGVIGLSWASSKSVHRFKPIPGSSNGQEVTSNALVWDQYYGDSKQFKYAVESGKYSSETEVKRSSGDLQKIFRNSKFNEQIPPFLQNYPIYVCRAMVDGIFASGNTRRYEDKVVCTVALQNSVKTHHAFELLINKGNGAKLSWKPWKKFGRIPTGAINSGLGGHVSENFSFH